MTKAVLGIIGGSGLYDLPGLEEAEWRDVASPWGTPSDQLRFGRIGETQIVFLPRHGRGHRLSPSGIDYRANIDALKRAGVTDLISVSAVGSLKQELFPGDFVLVDQFIDKTVARVSSFFGNGCVAHVSLARPVAPLVDDGERRIDALGEGAGAHDAADIRRDDHGVLPVEPVLDVARHQRCAEQVVGRDVEEALDLAGMQIECKHAVDAGIGDQVGDELGRDRRAAGGAPVLPGVAEIGDHRRDAPGRGATQRIDDDEQLHQVVVGWEGGGLDDEDILSAHIFLDLDEDFHVGEAPDRSLGKGYAEMVANRFGERPVGIAGDDFEMRGHAVAYRCRRRGRSRLGRLNSNGS